MGRTKLKLRATHARAYALTACQRGHPFEYPAIQVRARLKGFGQNLP